MDDGILNLQWNSHQSTFFNVLSTLHRKELYSDVTLACDGKLFPVHKLVLSVCSEYFEEIFKQTMCKHPVVILKDILHEDLEILLDYMYAGEANVAESDLVRLLKSAECLRIKGLKLLDVAPSSKDGKRSHSEKEENTLSKRRRHEESLSPSNSSSKSSRESSMIEGEQEVRENNEDTASHQSGGGTSYSTANTQQVAIPEVDPELGPPNQDESISQDLLEVVLEEQPVIKQEMEDPKPEPEDDMSHQADSESTISFDGVNDGDDGGGVPGGDDRADGPGPESQMMVSIPQNILHGIMVQGGPGPSAISPAMPRLNLLKRLSQDLNSGSGGGLNTPTIMNHESPPKMAQQNHNAKPETPQSEQSISSNTPVANVLTPIPHFLTINRLQGIPEFLKNYNLFKMNDYLGYRTKQQYWEEPAVRRVLEGIRNKEIDMKSAAVLLGVSYGTLYPRYREVFGYLKHSWEQVPPKRDRMANSDVDVDYSEALRVSETKAPENSNKTMPLNPSNPTVKRQRKDKIFECHECDASYQTLQDLQSHVKERHTSEGPFKCETCKFAFIYRRHFEAHRRRCEKGNKSRDLQLFISGMP